MSVTVDVFIKFNGSKAELTKILARDFLIVVGKKQYWFLGFIELGLTSRSEDKEYFSSSRKYRPYDYVLWGTSYLGSSYFGSVVYAHTTIFDTIAQILAGKLKTRTMCSVPDWGDHRQYRYIRRMKRNKLSCVIDEETRKPPKGFL